MKHPGPRNRQLVAELERHQDRDSWVSWAIEFVRRGLWPADVITVHGPHASSADHFWGDAEAWDESGTWSFTVAFQTPARHGWDRRRVRLWDAEHPGTHFPVVRRSAMSHAQRRWLRIARRLAATQWQTSGRDRKSTRLNSSHLGISYAVFCLKKKKKKTSTLKVRRDLNSCLTRHTSGQ